VKPKDSATGKYALIWLKLVSEIGDSELIKPLLLFKAEYTPPIAVLTTYISTRNIGSYKPGWESKNAAYIARRAAGIIYPPPL